jgi:hypothetical protein
LEYKLGKWEKENKLNTGKEDMVNEIPKHLLF